MRGRRRFLAALAAGAGAPWARAGERMRVIGYMTPEPYEAGELRLDKARWIEGKDFRVEVRVTDLDRPSYESAAAELVRRQVDALVTHMPPWVVALAAATRTIPIVCAIPDPVGLGVARTLARPGGNVTGLSGGLAERSQMTVAILKTLRPALKQLVSFHPVGAHAPLVNRPLTAAARDAGVTLDFAYVTTVADVERTFAAFRAPATVAVTLGGPAHPDEVAAAYREIARRKGIAALGGAREGALMDFALRHADADGRVGAILEKVLRGANPAEIPFELPDRTVFVLNRATAAAIGIRIPPEILMRASTVID